MRESDVIGWHESTLAEAPQAKAVFAVVGVYDDVRGGSQEHLEATAAIAVNARDYCESGAPGRFEGCVCWGRGRNALHKSIED